jgi:hypothetical protein
MNEYRTKTYTSFLLLALLCISLTAQQTPANDSAQENQKKARAVLDQMIKTLGGQAYLTLQNSESDGRSGTFYRGRSEGATLYHRLWEWPDKERVELTKQRDIIRLTLGAEMYEITFRGTRTVDLKQDYDSFIYVQRRIHSLETIVRQWINEPGVALFDEGPALVENHSVERVTVINAKNDAVTLSIDTDSHLPVKKSFVIRDPQGYRDEIAEIYDNWKLIQGINTPYNVLVTRNGELQRQYFLNTISYNVPMQASLFQPGSTFNVQKK